MSLELSNENLRTLIDLVAGGRVQRLGLADRYPGSGSAVHREAADGLENLRVRLASELSRREPGAAVLEHTERVRDLVMRWREVALLVEGTPPNQELPVDVLKMVVGIWRKVQKLDDPTLNAEYRAWAEEHNLPSGNPPEETT